MRVRLLIVLILYYLVPVHGQIYHVNESFDSLILPSTWTNTAISGSNSWNFGVDAASLHPGNQNINGTGLAYFDDDVLGSISINNTASLSTPIFDNASSAQTTLEFDYNFRTSNGIADSFFVEVWDGSLWQKVFSRSSDDCGSWITPNCVGNFPHALVNISSHANANCQVRFTYHDGNNWGWYVGLDNVQIYSPATDDIQVSEILSPTTHCGLNSAEIMQVKIKNLGTNTANNFIVSFDIDNSSQLFIDTISTSILGGDSLTYTFNDTADFSQIKSYSLQAFTTHIADLVPFNDTAISTINNFAVFNLPFEDDFEGISHWDVSGTNPSWALGIPNNSIIDSAYSGTNAYVTNLTGNYNNNEISYLTTPCLNFSNGIGDPILSFKLNHITETFFDYLEIEYTIDGGSNWLKLNTSPLFSMNWNNNGTNWNGNSNGWISVYNILDGLGGQSNVRIRFKFQSDGSSSFEGIAIDDVAVFHPFLKDMTITELITPNGNQDCGLGQSNIIVNIQNQGAIAIDTCTISYQVNNGSIHTDTLIRNIQPYDTIKYQFSSLFNFTGMTTAFINCWINTSGDLNGLNDSASSQFSINPMISARSIPFFEDFETFPNGISSANGWAAIPNGGVSYRWIVDSIGNPIFSTGPLEDHTAGAGSKYMYTNSTTPGGNRQIATLESPCIDLTNINNPNLEFWYHKYGNTMSDLFIDIFNGNTWVRGIDNIAGQTHFNQTDPYLKRSINLNAFAGQRIKVAFRTSAKIGFRSDMAIDDILIFNYLRQDIALNKFIIIDKCLNDTIPITIEIENRGTDSILANSLLLYYQIDNNIPIVDTLKSSLASSAKINFTFSTTANLSTRGSAYQIKCWSQLNSDSNHRNDTIKTIIKNQIIRADHLETFDGFQFIDGACDDPLFDTIGNGWSVSQTNYRWNIQNSQLCNGAVGATPTLGSGPSGDHTTGNGKFFYTEADPMNGTVMAGDIASLTSPCIDYQNDSNAVLSFWYHKYGGKMGDLFIDVYANGNWTNGIDTIIGETHNSINDKWLFKELNISNWAIGNQIQIRFRAIRGAGAKGDMAIDDIRFLIPITQDARIEQVLSPTSACQPTDTIRIKIANFGLQAITTPFMAAYRINGGMIVRNQVSSPIPLGQEINFEFSTPATFSQNNTTYNIEAWTELPNDSNTYNDTIKVDIFNTTKNLNYLEDFESFIDGQCSTGPTANMGDVLLNGWEEVSTQTYQWAVQDLSVCSGTPTGGTGPSTDHTLGNGTFLYTEASGAIGTAIIVSPCIDLNNVSSAIMEFWFHRYGTNMGDLNVDVLDNGVWLNGVLTLSGNTQNTSASPWSLASISLSQYTGSEINIRFRGIHGGGVQGDMAIDDIRIYDSLATSLSSIDLSNKNIKIYPSPSNGVFTLEVASDLVHQSYQIYNLNGILIQEGILINRSSTIELENSTKGVYLLRIGQSNLTRKIIIH